MKSHIDQSIQYYLPLSDNRIYLNDLINQTIKLHFTEHIFCVVCGKKTKKSFHQGYCFPCTRRLAQCDLCILKPELCHYNQGTCREPEWAETHCFEDHIVYLSNASGIKVGITRLDQVPTRWIDQGAIQALPIYRVKNRLLSGLIEVAYKAHISDKTNWRQMLKGNIEAIDLKLESQHLFAKTQSQVESIKDQHGPESVMQLSEDAIQLNYPVSQYPDKIKSLNFDKAPLIESKLMGIKGQYLIFESGVINMRKFSGYQIHFDY